jgi:hypothetical protein
MGFLQRLAERLQRAFHRSPPALRRVLAMLVDALIVIESFALALLFRFAGNVDPLFWGMFWPFAIFSALAFVLLLNGNSVYRSIVRQGEAPLGEQMGEDTGLFRDARLVSATAIAAGGLFLTVFCVGPGGLGITKFHIVPLSVVLVGSLFAYVQLAWAHLAWVRLRPRV